jgi:hypothetical protein
MDRTIVYSAALPRTADLLVFERAAEIGLSYLTQSLLGATTTLASGLVAAPGTGLTVVMGAGAFYQLEPVDATSYGSLTLDTSDQVLKQGLQLVGVTLSGFAAPGTSGQSINYLIEAQFQPVDTTPVVFKYRSSVAPYPTLQGQNNSNVAQFSIRSGQIAYNVKAGTAATTGTQTTPAADSGWTGLYAVTVTNGQTSIPGGQINAIPNAPFLAGLLNSHHNGKPGQAPGIILGPSWLRAGATGFEVQNRLAAGNIQSSDDVGTFSATQTFVGNPNGSLAGNAGIVGSLAPSIAWDPTNGILWACITSGNSATAVWQRIPKIPTPMYTPINSSQLLPPGMYTVDTSAAPVTVTMEAVGNYGDNYTFFDFADTWATNNLILNPNGSTIMGRAQNMLCDVNGLFFQLAFSSGNWSLQ